MNYITVTLPKSEYDKLVEFREEVQKGKIAIVYYFAGYEEEYWYMAKEDIMSSINQKEDQARRSMERDYEYKIKEYDSQIKKKCLTITGLEIKIISRDNTIKELLQESSSSWWRFW